MTEKRFTGPHKEQLTALANLIDWLWQEHSKSFVKAGDDKVYAFGGDGYILVLDESKWEGLLEFVTPQGTLTIKPGEDGNPVVSGGTLDEKATKKALGEGVEQIRKYYETRYWSTPKAS